MAKLIVNKKGLIVLFIIFCFIYFLNSITPLFNEDYFVAFVWPMGVPNLGVLPDNAKRVSGLMEVFENVKVYYLTEGGRVAGTIPYMFFSWQGKEYFDPINAFMMTILVAEIYWLSHEGKLTLDFDLTWILWIFFALWSFNMNFVGTCLWMCGSSNYLWMIVVILLFLIPYVQNYFDKQLPTKQDGLVFSIVMFILGLLAGNSHETTNGWIVLLLGFWLFLSMRRKVLKRWHISGFLGFCIGLAVLVLAPGNYARLKIAQVNYAVSSSFRITEFVMILLFHYFLWSLLFLFFVKWRKKICLQQNLATYFNLAKTFTLIAFCSVCIMCFVPVAISRPSFLTLVYLIIAVALLFRAEEKSGISVIGQKVRRVLYISACFYFVFTVSVSVYGNYGNWKHWNRILSTITAEQGESSNSIVEVTQSSTSGSGFWLWGSGLHLIAMPVNPGDERINRIVAKYYRINGFKFGNKK